MVVCLFFCYSRYFGALDGSSGRDDLWSSVRPWRVFCKAVSVWGVQHNFDWFASFVKWSWTVNRKKWRPLRSSVGVEVAESQVPFRAKIRTCCLLPPHPWENMSPTSITTFTGQVDEAVILWSLLSFEYWGSTCAWGVRMQFHIFPGHYRVRVIEELTIEHQQILEVLCNCSHFNTQTFYRGLRIYNSAKHPGLENSARTIETIKEMYYDTLQIYVSLKVWKGKADESFEQIPKTRKGTTRSVIVRPIWIMKYRYENKFIHDQPLDMEKLILLDQEFYLFLSHLLQ